MAYSLGIAGRPSSFWEFEPRFAEDELERQLKGVRQLISESEGYFLRDAFRDLPDYAADGRLLIVERVEGGRRRVEGCVAYAQPLLQGVDATTGQTIIRRVTMLRLLVVRESDDRSELALRLCLEAHLRATIRAMHDDEDRPHAIGTFGVVMRSNEPAFRWTLKLGRPRRRIVRPTSHNVKRDPTLALVFDLAETIRISTQSEEEYILVIGNRRNLVEAAVLHRAGRLPTAAATGDLAVYYDSAGGDPYQPWVDLAVDNISWGNPVTFHRLGLSGPRWGTIWGPPPTAQMRLGEGRPSREGT